MTDLSDVAQGRAVAARWCALAEQRLRYLTELFETGRWRRFYSETQFLENVREAKANVDHWRALSTSAVQPNEDNLGSPDQADASPTVRAPAISPVDLAGQSPAAVQPVEQLAAAIAAMPGMAAVQDRYPLLRNEL